MRHCLIPIVALALTEIIAAPATTNVVLDNNYSPSVFQIEQANLTSSSVRQLESTSQWSCSIWNEGEGV